ncbi:hypothetical protein [Bradyrhizobium sp. SEMIA]|uniref:hypothetical protein n=1 Tax=Bradyrhizobium sp. SEMIA TaxID=2597515 RepID=UPI00223F0E62|nr:hypothetical protein [Bradyrhizobium sp. SEMIA]
MRAIMRASAVSAGKGCTRIVIDSLDLLSTIGLPQSHKIAIGKRSRSSRSLNQQPRKPFPARNCAADGGVESVGQIIGGKAMGFGRGALLWLLGIPLPIILLLAIFWHY